MKQMAELKNGIEKWDSLKRRLLDAKELASMLSEDSDEALEKEVRIEAKRLEKLVNKYELETAFTSEYDAKDAILAIHAGAGGEESQDWAEMLLRMFLRWAEKNGYKANVLEVSQGDGAGIKSATIKISGEYASGFLKSEHGVHRLVRLSPFDADHARHTSFALVEVMPEAGEDVGIDINPSDLKVETFRSSGPGGQHMQKTSSAVRITHLPSGVIAICQSERSQHQNKEVATQILKTRLLNIELQKAEEERAKLKGDRIVAGWSNQIRSYVLHPYRMVKDHRTGYETGNTDAVLDGDITEFINAYVRHGGKKA